MDPLTQGILLYSVLLISLVVHEAAHALAALWGGDRTAYYGGQVTLNPIPHIQREPFGTVILPIAILFFSNASATMGFAHAPFDPLWARRHPRRAAFMAAAGPLGNFLLVLLAASVLKILIWSGEVEIHETYLLEVFSPSDNAQDGPVRAACLICTVFIFLNLLLGILNLIPVPPLDGAGVVSGLFPRSAGRFYDRVAQQPMMRFLPMILVFYLFFNFGERHVLVPAFNFVVELLKL